MADETRVKWLYPPNFPGTFDAGIKDGCLRYVVQCTNYSDGSGEDDSIKMKRTDLLTPNGNVPGRLVVEKVKYSIAGMTVIIGYNNENEDEVCRLYSGEDEIDYTSIGGFIPEPRTTSGDEFEGGDIVFSTENESDGDSYNIILTVRVKD
jgi:hypothetical protein